MMKKHSGFIRGETPAEKATLESFCVYRTKLPRPVMTSDVDKNGLALDMLNDLKKCPKELFELLSKEKQQKFREKDAPDDTEDGQETLMRRYSDRFPYFAIRYCDENEVFENLRFHIDLGKYYFKFYEKQTIDGGTYQRALDKRLKTFGRIKEVKSKVKQEWDEIIKSPGEINDEQNEPYKADTSPHYHLVDNQIGFVISGNSDLPDITPSDGKIKLKKPDAWLSIYELPGMLFHGLENGFNKTEWLITEYIKKQRKICEKIFETGITPENEGEFFPETLKNIEMSDAKQNDYAGDKLDRMLDETNQRIRAIKTTRQRMADTGNKPGKKNFVDIRAGKLADFLARDIIALQKFDPDKKGKDKLTSTNFQVLQATLAYYGAKKDTIRDMFQRIGLLDGDNPHPFLKEINPGRHHSIISFYEAYLDNKRCYLEKCKEEGNLDDHQFLRPSRQRYAIGKREVKTIAKQLLDNPVNIPKGFFQKKIKELVCDEDSSLNGRKMNTAYMIQAWFEKMQGTQQPLYGYEKTYPVVSKAEQYSKKRANNKIVKALQSISPEMNYRDLQKYIETEIPEKGRYDPENLRQNLLKGCKDFKNNERLLRRFKVQDMVTFLMVERTLKEQLSLADHNLKLEAITPVETSPFKNPISCDTDITVSFNTKPDHYESVYVDYIKEKYEGSYSGKGNKMELKYRVTSENTKLKDLGKYRRYFYDRRLPGLLIWKYAPNAEAKGEIKYAALETEIMAYDQHKLAITVKLFELERNVIADYKLQIKPDKNLISYNEIIEKVKERLPESNDKCDTLLSIRNAVYHNQFPVYQDAIENAQGENIADKMLSVTQDYVNDITEQITQSDKELENV